MGSFPNLGWGRDWRCLLLSPSMASGWRERLIGCASLKMAPGLWSITNRTRLIRQSIRKRRGRIGPQWISVLKPQGSCLVGTWLKDGCILQRRGSFGGWIINLGNSYEPLQLLHYLSCLMYQHFRVLMLWWINRVKNHTQNKRSRRSHHASMSTGTRWGHPHGDPRDWTVYNVRLIKRGEFSLLGIHRRWGFGLSPFSRVFRSPQRSIRSNQPLHLVWSLFVVLPSQFQFLSHYLRWL